MRHFSSVVIVILCLSFCTQITKLFAQVIRTCGTQEAFEKFKRGEKLLRPPDGTVHINTPHFIIHFDTSGANACSHAYAETTAIYAEYAWAKYTGLGLAAAPPDTSGPDSRYDIYIHDWPGWNGGYCEMDGPYPTPYPDGMTSYIGIWNQLPWEYLRENTVHEFAHAVQFRYGGEYGWWYENSAMLMEHICELPGWDTLQITWLFNFATTNPLTDPDYPIISTTNFYQYGGYLWALFLHDYYSIATQRLIWEKIGEVPGENSLSAIDTVLKLYDSNLKAAMRNYAVWRYFTGSRADTIHYFKYSDLMPTSYVDPAHQHQGPGSGNQGTRSPMGPGGTSFIEFYTTPDYLLKTSILGGPPEGEWQVSNVGISRQAGHKQYLMDTIDYWSVLPTMSHDTFVLIPTVGNQYGVGQDYSYTGAAIAADPTPPQDPELQVCSILAPTDTVAPYSDVMPRSIRRNNGTSTVDSTWTSFYIGDAYGDSRRIGPLGSGQSDTITYENWTAKERKSFDVQCVAGGSYDVNRANNCCTASVFVPLTDVEVLEILSPRGVTTQNVSVTPSVRLRNNGTGGTNVSVSFVMPNYTDTRSIYLGPGLSGDISFNNWTPTQLGECTTRTRITIPDQRPFNDSLNGLVSVVPPPSVKENSLTELSFRFAVKPNPFSNSTKIQYTIPVAGQSSIRLFDIKGSLIRIICDKHQPAGVYVRTLTAKNLTDGVYFLVIQSGDYREIKKIVRTK